MIRDSIQTRMRVISCDAEEGCDAMERKQLRLDGPTTNQGLGKGWFFMKGGLHFCPKHMPDEPGWKRKMY